MCEDEECSVSDGADDDVTVSTASEFSDDVKQDHCKAQLIPC